MWNKLVMNWDTTIFVVNKCKIIAYIKKREWHFVLLRIKINRKFQKFTTIKMIVDECDKYELQDIVDTYSFNFSTADSWVRSRIVSGGEGGRCKLKGVRTKSNQFNVFFLTTFNIYIENSRFGGMGVRTSWSLLDPPLYSIHFIHYNIAIPITTIF
jgi:hypothetical protein